jgi:hypothetical protein
LVDTHPPLLFPMPRSTQERAVLALLILWSHSCLAYGRYRYSLAVEKAVAKFSNFPRGGEQRPKFWSIFKKLADAKEEATTADAGKKDPPRNPLYLSNGDGRGGAMMVKKSRAEMRVEKQYVKEKLQPVDDKSPSEVEPAEENVNLSKENAVSAMTRLWWVNLRNMADLGEEQADGHDKSTSAEEKAVNIDTILSVDDQGSFVYKDTAQNSITYESNDQEESGEDCTEESGEDCTNDGGDLEFSPTVVLTIEEKKPAVVDRVPDQNDSTLETDAVAGDEDASLDSDDILDDTTDAPGNMDEEMEVLEELAEAIIDVAETEFPFSDTSESVDHKAEPNEEESVEVAVEGTDVAPPPDLSKYSSAKAAVVEESQFISSGLVSSMNHIVKYTCVLYVFLKLRSYVESGRLLTSF